MPLLLPPVCLLAGGRGTRLGALTDEIPKPMVSVAGRPFIEWPLMQLRGAGFTHIVVCTGYRGESIERHLGDGAHLGLSLVYSPDGPSPAGTLGAVRKALPLLGDRVPILYADTYLQVDFAAVVRDHDSHDLPITMTVIHNAGSWDVSNSVVDGDRVIAYGKHPPPPAAEWIDYGFSIMDASVVEASESSDLADLTADSAAASLVRAFKVSKRFWEIGTPEALRETDAFLQSLGSSN